MLDTPIVEDSTLAAKKLIINFFTPVAGFYFVLYFIHSMVNGNYPLATIHGLSLLSLVINLIVFYNKQNIAVALHFLAFISIPAVLPFLIEESPMGIGFVWTTVAMVWMFFLLNTRQAFIWLGVYFAIALAIIILGLNGFVELQYTLTELLQLGFLFLFMILLLFFFNKSRALFEQLSNKRASALADSNNKLLLIQDALEEANMHLTEEIEERKVMAKDLLQAKIKADESNKIKDAFLANMSHEIRTPMNAIIGFSEMLQQRDLADEEMDFVNTIKSSSDNLLSIINDILDLSKIDAGMIEFEKSPINITSLLNSLYGMMSFQAHEKKVSLTLDTHENIPQALIGDPVRLTQILINLVGNAIKFTQNGTVHITTSLVKKEENLRFVCFEVKDSGIGIPKDKLKKIFDRFRQAETTTTRNYGGTGLGLSIAKQLVELQGGSIEVASVVGEGSTFSVTIPFAKGREELQDFGAASHGKLDVKTLKSLKVLLAEDNVINVKFMTALFANYNLTFDLANNGREVLAMLKEKQYDLVLMDIEMPEMNGYEATKAIRNELRSDIPIIALSAHAMAGETEKCLKIGMNAYVSKPVKAVALFEIIDKLTAYRPKLQATDVETVTKGGLDLGFLKESLGDDEVWIKEMIDLLLKQVPKNLLEIDNAIAKKDLLLLKGLAHKLKPSTSYVGVKDFIVIATKFDEVAYDASDIKTLTSLNETLQKVGKKALLELKAYRKTLVD